MPNGIIKKDPHGPVVVIGLVVFLGIIFYFIIMRILSSDGEARRILLKPVDDKRKFENYLLLGSKQQA